MHRSDHNDIDWLHCLSIEYTILTFLPKNLYEQFRRSVLPAPER